MTTTTAFAWRTLPTAELASANGITGQEADPAAVEDARTHGIPDPLYVVPDDHGSYRVAEASARASLAAAAAAAELETVPVTLRPVIRIESLTPHPKNAREDLHLTDEFVESFRIDGCRIPVLIQRLPDGRLQVNDGNRRHQGAQQAGLTHVPYGWDDLPAAEQHLQMITTARHSQKLSEVEEAAALFDASEAGATTKRLAQVAGVSQKRARAAVRVGQSPAARQAATGTAWSLEEYGELARLEKRDPEAASEIATLAAKGGFDARWRLRTAHKQLDIQAEAEQHRAELESAGARIMPLAELSDRARPLSARPPRSERGGAHHVPRPHLRTPGRRFPLPRMLRERRPVRPPHARGGQRHPAQGRRLRRPARGQAGKHPLGHRNRDAPQLPCPAHPAPRPQARRTRHHEPHGRHGHAGQHVDSGRPPPPGHRHRSRVPRTPRGRRRRRTPGQGHRRRQAASGPHARPLGVRPRNTDAPGGVADRQPAQPVGPRRGPPVSDDPP
ncbi:ParB N-terminal domain-containing protein [Streptomyces sp. GKU 257-1]|nr:ParB N-terminal domain-containing protein [Streptomyces sp. GKU 257-1]